MRKIAVLLLVILLGVFICSCGQKGESVIRNRDQKMADKRFDAVLDAIHNHDKDALVLLFSKESLSEVNVSDETVAELFEYFAGEVIEYYDWGGPYVEMTKENGQVIQIVESTYDVKTTVCEYRFAMRYISKNTIAPDSVGVESLYIIKKADDVDATYAYWGDGAYTPGINIGIPNAI